MTSGDRGIPFRRRLVSCALLAGGLVLASSCSSVDRTDLERLNFACTSTEDCAGGWVCDSSRICVRPDAGSAGENGDAGGGPDSPGGQKR